MTYIRHYDLKERPFGQYERGEGIVHGTEFGGEPELFASEAYALADFADWLSDSYPDGVAVDGSFVGWGVVFRCKTHDGADRLVSVDVEEEEKE